MEGVAFDEGRGDLLAAEDVLERAPHGGGARAGGAGDGNDRMRRRHAFSSGTGRADRKAVSARRWGRGQVIAIEPRDFVARAEDQRHALMEPTRQDVEDALAAGRGGAARLLDEPRDRVRFVDEPQAAVVIAVAQVARIHVDAAAREHAMRFRHHRSDPAHVEVVAARAFGALQAVVDVDADRLVPVPVIGGVDGELARLRRHAARLRR